MWQGIKSQYVDTYGTSFFLTRFFPSAIIKSCLFLRPVSARIASLLRQPRYAFNVGFGTLWAFISGMLVYAFAPAAAGSGIPEVKTILNPGIGLIGQKHIPLLSLASMHGPSMGFLSRLRLHWFTETGNGHFLLFFFDL